MIVKCEDSFGELPVCIHDGNGFRKVGRISVIEVIDNEKNECAVKSLILRLEDPQMESLGVELREGRDESWMQKHA